jgi:hypothetical protein
MDTIAKRLDEARKAKLGEQLTAKSWDPKEGDILAGELVHREVITRKEDQKHYDKVVLRADEGLYETIIKAGVLALAKPPVIPGDIFVIRYNGLVPIGDGKRSMHDSTVEVYHTGTPDGAPF